MCKRSKISDVQNATSIQSKMAVASFVSGVVIACVCLFFIPPRGEIHTTAISVVSELLILSGALLGLKASFDAKQQSFAAQITAALAKKQDRPTE